MFSFLGTPLGWIMRFLYWFIPNYGLTLVVFTIIIRLALFPLNVKQQKTTAKMGLLQPKMQALQKKYGKNKEKYQEEMMKLYQEEGYNPMSSCLPMVLQMAVLFGIIDVVYKPLKHLLSISKDTIAAATHVLTEAGVKATGYMELPIINAIQTGKVGDIAIAPSAFDGVFSADMMDKIRNFDLNFLGLNLGGNPNWTSILVLIPLLSGITSLIVSIVSIMQQKKSGMTAGGGMMKAMMYIMPLFSTWIAFSLPCGVGLYWIISNIFSIFQTIILFKVYSPEKMKAQAEKEAAERKRRPSRYQQAMAQAMEIQAQKNGTAPSGKEKPVRIPKSEDDITDSQVIALARKRMAEKYGDDEE